MVLFSMSIQNIWMKWNTNPVTYSFSEKQVSISSIPFPMITVCPETKTMRDKLDLISVYYSKLMNVSKSKFYFVEFFSPMIPIKSSLQFRKMRLDAIVHLCKNFSHSIQFYGLEWIYDDFTEEWIYDVIADMAPSFNNTHHECRWKRVQGHNCYQNFVHVLTEKGLCYAINVVNSHEIYTEQ